MQPIVNGLEAEFEGDLAFERFDANSEDGQMRMRAYDLRGHPSYVIVDSSGEKLWSFSGQLTEENLRGQILATLP